MATGLLAPPGLAPLSRGPAGRGGRGEVGTRQMSVSADSFGGGGGIGLSILTSDDDAQVVRPVCHPSPHYHTGFRPKGGEEQDTWQNLF